jgi:peptide/nickel transport system substrate-binding protein
VEFLVLGPVEVRIDGRTLPLGGPKQRALLSLLLLSLNEAVSRDRLIDSLWGERAPTSAQRSLDTYVSRLRALLGADRIERHPPGYLLRVEPGELDLERFEALLEQGRAAAAADDPAAAKERLAEALALWRGRALADLESEPFLGLEAERLEERRLLALEARIDAELELGGGSHLVGELERLGAEYPFRERFVGQLMLSLYRAGRKADGLAAYQACRRRFAEELGIEPSSELSALERRILDQDPALGAVRAAPRVARSRRITRVPIVAAVLALAAVAAGVIAGIELGTGGSKASTALGSTAGVFELGSGSSVVAGSSLDDAPAAMAADAHSLWLTEPDAGAVIRVDRTSGQSVERIQVGGTPSALTVGGGAVWVASVPGAIVDRIDPTTEAVTRKISLGGARASALAFGLGRLWVADTTDETLLGFDPLTGTLQQTLRLDLHPTALAVGKRAIWVADYDASQIAQVDPRSGDTIASIRVGNGPVAVTFEDGAVWVANRLDSTVSKLNPESDTVATTTSVGSYPVALAIKSGSVFVANEYSSTVSRIDARTGLVRKTISVGGGPTALVSAGGRIWVGTRALKAHRGGTLVLLHTAPLSLDPALQADVTPVQSNGLTSDALLTHFHTDGPQALLLVPDLAVSIPNPTDRGTTYTFRLRRPAIRYSDGRVVRASDFRRAIERLFRLQGPWSGNYLSIVGASACTTRRCDLASGIVTDDARGTITFHLRAPDPDFLSNLTSIATAPVPPRTPFHDVGTHPIPGTGPYVVASSNKHKIRYVRNRLFHEWSHAAQPDGNPDVIVMRYGLSQAQEVRAVERGRADWTGDGVPPKLDEEVTTRFPAELHRLQAAQIDFFRLNTTQAPFDDLRVRRALNLAIDRAAVVRLYGGAARATPSCQVLRPGDLGYRRYCPYTHSPRVNGHWTAPDLARARRLVAASGTRGEQVTVWGQTDGGILGTEVVRYTVHVLRRLGYRARAHLVPWSYLGGHPQAWTKIQLIPLADGNGTPFDLFHSFACSKPPEYRWFCDTRLDRTVREAATLDVTDPRTAGTLVTRIDRELVARAAWVPLVNPHWIDFVSRRVRNYEADPDLGLIADQAVLR